MSFGRKILLTSSTCYCIFRCLIYLNTKWSFQTHGLRRRCLRGMVLPPLEETPVTTALLDSLGSPLPPAPDGGITYLDGQCGQKK